jgi:uncharacterized protein (DUF934 family)
MRRILRLHDSIPDEWRYLGEEATEADPLIVQLPELRAHPDTYRARPGKLGVRVSPADPLEELASLPSFALVAVEFPGPGEGRGFSQGRLLRERYGFKGELRAVGAGVKQDKLFLLARCGFDAFELAPGESEEEARRALRTYSVAYQRGSENVPIRYRPIGSSANEDR